MTHRQWKRKEGLSDWLSQTQTLHTPPEQACSLGYSRQGLRLFCFIIDFYTSVLDMLRGSADWGSVISLAFIFVRKAAVPQGQAES